jgi:hypothetical protein
VAVGVATNLVLEVTQVLLRPVELEPPGLGHAES